LVGDYAPAGTESSGPRELKRAARRLRLPPQRLEQARLALREGTDLALRLEALPVDQLYLLANTWIQLNRPEAVNYLERIFYSVQQRATSATPEQYVRLIQPLPQILQALSTLDSQRAQDLLQRWPAPPAQLNSENSVGGGTVSTRSWEQLKGQAEQAIMKERVRHDPQQVASLLDKSSSDQSVSYYDRGALANQLSNGHYERGEALVREGIRRFQSQPLTSQTVREFMQMLQTIGWNYPDAVGAGAKTLIRRLRTSDVSNLTDQPMFLRSSDQSVQLGPTERVALELLRGLGNRPGLVSELMGQMPGLDEKLNMVGGLDTALRSGSWTVRPDGSVEQNLTPQRAAKASASTASETVRDLKAEASRDPEAVRRKLRELAQDPANFDALTQAIYDYTWDYPELAEAAVDLAKGLVDALEPVAYRAYRLLNLIRAERNLDGEADRSLLYKGFDLVRQMQDEEREPAAQPEASAAEGSAPPARRAADRSGVYALSASEQIYADFIAELARLDAPAAISRTRSLPDSPFKLNVLLRIAQSLGQPD
jgi:hypothetical protein